MDNRLRELQSIPPEDFDVVVRITREEDIAIARQMAKQLAQELDFTLADGTKIATAVSELARNIYRYAQTGKVMIRKCLEKNSASGENDEPAIEVLAIDHGPGIEDVEQALARGFTTHERSLGIGLAGVQRLMDFFEIVSEVGAGTVVRVRKRRRKF